MYKTKVIEIGEMVPEFESENLVVLFGPEATEELRDICVMHESENDAEGVLVIGTKLCFGEQEYEIIEVGSAANENFTALGHISVYFKDEKEDVLPGGIIARPCKFPEIKEGDVITIG